MEKTLNLILVDSNKVEYEIDETKGFKVGDLIAEIDSESTNKVPDSTLIKVNKIHAFRDGSNGQGDFAPVYYEKEPNTIQGIGKGTERFKVKLKTA